MAASTSNQSEGQFILCDEPPEKERQCRKHGDICKRSHRPDSYWDTRNYHIYNAYAFLNGRVGFDLAPAMMQSYFNPLLDVPYYLMAMHWPPRLVGFVMGTMHGLNFVLVSPVVTPNSQRNTGPRHPARDSRIST